MFYPGERGMQRILFCNQSRGLAIVETHGVQTSHVCTFSNHLTLILILYNYNQLFYISHAIKQVKVPAGCSWEFHWNVHSKDICII